MIFEANIFIVTLFYLLEWGRCQFLDMLRFLRLNLNNILFLIIHNVCRDITFESNVYAIGPLPSLRNIALPSAEDLLRVSYPIEFCLYEITL